ncbi:hypothetical protein C5167_037096 [Papaver somniferum]|uniref:Uncharacterized protein n=1 Tax=Papaver somniferum TaxID=3469 RepID=A0A4Y7I940_PAPSO|nr:hypothetical protein C5167_037096 [Papaver somniferum]
MLMAAILPHTDPFCTICMNGMDGFLKVVVVVVDRRRLVALEDG